MENIHSTTYIDDKTSILGNTQIGKNCKIINSVLDNAIIGDNVCITNSTITKSKIGNGVSVGPYAHIRNEAEIGDQVRIGNFVEIKNSFVGKRTKVAHLAYIGDAEIGEDVNVGCGVIFANYDGKNKHKTIVGDRVFIGSNSNLIAPLFVENDVFIAAGTTVTSNLSNGDFCIGRVRNEIKKDMENLYAQKFFDKLKFFGTDGIRGVYGKKLTDELAQKVGFALTKLKPNPRVLVGRDTRPSGDNLFKAISQGVSQGGGEVVDISIAPTASVCYMTKLLQCDFGVVITASHNPCEYNGIKIFSSNGYKLNENQEKQIEDIIENCSQVFDANPNIISAQKRAYIEMLESVGEKMEDKTIFLDCANGATAGVAPKIYKNLGANIVEKNTFGEINKNAGVLDLDLLKSEFDCSGAEIGFAFDGDGDRVMFVCPKGILNGDRILYVLAKYTQEKFAVGTIMTNSAMEQHLQNIGTKLVRVDVGDKNIAKAIKSKKYKIGAEESGHVIIGGYLQTGDGILTSLVLAKIYFSQPEIIDQALALEMYDTVNLCVETENKKIIKNDDFLNYKVSQEKMLKKGRIIVRASGTEPKIRIIVEGENKEKNIEIATNIKNYLENMLKN